MLGPSTRDVKNSTRYRPPCHPEDYLFHGWHVRRDAPAGRLYLAAARPGMAFVKPILGRPHHLARRELDQGGAYRALPSGQFQQIIAGSLRMACSAYGAQDLRGAGLLP